MRVSIDIVEEYKTTVLGDYRQEKERNEKKDTPGWIGTSTQGTLQLDTPTGAAAAPRTVGSSDAARPRPPGEEEEKGWPRSRRPREPHGLPAAGSSGGAATGRGREGRRRRWGASARAAQRGGDAGDLAHKVNMNKHKRCNQISCSETPKNHHIQANTKG